MLSVSLITEEYPKVCSYIHRCTNTTRIRGSPIYWGDSIYLIRDRLIKQSRRKEMKIYVYQHTQPDEKNDSHATKLRLHNMRLIVIAIF